MPRALFNPNASRSVRWMVATMLVAGCLPVGNSSVQYEFKNKGLLCLYPASETMGVPSQVDGKARTYAAGQPVNVAVQFLTCLPCGTEHVSGTCAIDLSSGTLQATSDGSFDEVTTGEGACTGDCRFFVAHCATPSLPAGAYTVHHGTDSLPLTVPSSGPPPCAGVTATAN